MSELSQATQPADPKVAFDSPPTTSAWYVYLVRTSQGVLYTGISTDPVRRLRQHRGELKGGAKALRGKEALELVWQHQATNRSVASQWEFKLKQLPKKAKEQLVAMSWLPDFLSAANRDSDSQSASKRGPNDKS
ncbi:MAG: GIY-YIG nuclease family protein [Gammaproteobacteria bacterium]|nr:GIY-YIG nuclease family protein [Gammaproteobacteria bacterium]MBU2278916.1 GIY-YIG nuclease family protein [Gammaproteobacteria bacterium]